MASRFAAVALALPALSGCAALIDKPPASPTAAAPPPSFTEMQGQTADQPGLTWWAALSDPMLNDLVDRALLDNRDVLAATAEVRRQRALGRLEGWSLLPNGVGFGEVTRRTSAGAQFGQGGSGAVQNFGFDGTDVYAVGFEASWEFDVWGRLRANTKAAKANALSAAAARRGALVSAAAEVSRAYVRLRGAQARLTAAETNAATQRRTLELTLKVKDAGRGTRLDVARAREQLATTLAQIPQRRAEIAAESYALGVLVGATPDALLAELADREDVPAPPDTLQVGAPSDLLRRRPDIVAAERDLEAAVYRLGAARVDWWPRVSFNSSLGSQSLTLANIAGPASFFYTVGPRIDWPLLDFRRNQLRAEAARAGVEAEYQRFDLAIVAGLRDVETAIAALIAACERVRQLTEAVAAAQDAADLSLIRYTEGVEPFFTVLDAEQRLAQAQDNLALAQTDSALAYVALGQALGVGWEAGPTVTAASQAHAK